MTNSTYIYVVDRDFGFAPNPFRGYCTLATCKPQIRRGAMVGDWVIGMGGKRLCATGRCVYAMRVTEKLTFETYWSDPRFLDKRPVRNGSSVMMVGDNIYHRDTPGGLWHQTDSHHSNPDGTPNPVNLKNDTSANHVLVSEHFYYFGRAACSVPVEILDALGYRNGRGFRRFQRAEAARIINWVELSFSAVLNEVVDDPFDFDASAKRYSPIKNKIV